MTENPGLDEITNLILQAFPVAIKVVLFGSRARRVHDPDSDFDLLVVTPTDLPPAERGAKARLALRGSGASFDIVVVTPDEFERLRHWQSSVVSRALRDGEILHEAA